MIDALAKWLQQIIAVVLLASLADLLLPNRVMQRYVRLVAGLFILLTMVTPLLQWIRGDFGERLAMGIESASRSPESSADELARIREDGERLQAVWAERAATLATDRLAGEIEREVEREQGVDVRRVEVDVETTPEGQRVAGITLVLAAPAEPAGPASSPGRGIAEVEPVAPVDVRIGTDELPVFAENGAGVEPEQASPERLEGESEADSRTRQKIAAQLAARWGVSADRIAVVTEAGGGNSG
ncbi:MULTISPECIES: stage III sporulation protein AF [Cohnella]|uniref:stage III sporulation protein AF n=1 Tax=Cohnella TaxID=329857 RepID=UPI0009BA782D|nr:MULTISPECIES: stage III sporulation protein AF [Cohnella]MBN2984448.1 stage III sporulation protein AF [Cohnella algarum]